MKRAANAAEKSHMGKVSAMGCIVCLHCNGIHDTPAVVHHVRVKHGWGRSSHFLTIPLCPEHHDGATGVHSMGRVEFEAMHGYSEIDLLAIVQERLAA